MFYLRIHVYLLTASAFHRTGRLDQTVPPESDYCFRSSLIRSILFAYFEKKYLFEKKISFCKTISVCNVVENLARHGIYCLPCFYTNEIIDVTVTTMTS